MTKNSNALKTISEAAEELDIPQHVLRFWETRFSQIRPMKRTGGRRFYRPEDVELVRAIRVLLYDRGYTIKGVQRILKEQGVRAILMGVADAGLGADAARSGEATRSDGIEERAQEDSQSHKEPPPPYFLEEARAMIVEIDDCLRLLRGARR